jgi:hypothetical protein
MNYVRKVSLTGVALFMALAGIIILGGWVLAAVPPNLGTTRIALMTKQVSQGNNQSISVSAQLTDADKPLGNEPVEFSVAANFFGDKQVNLGIFQTDATGTAIIIYQPTWDGAYDFTATFKGDRTYSPVKITKTITYSGPVPQYQNESVGLTSVRQWITPSVFIGVGIVWLLLLFIGIRTLRGIYRAGRRTKVESRSYKPFGQVVYQKRSSEN